MKLDLCEGVSDFLFLLMSVLTKFIFLLLLLLLLRTCYSICLKRVSLTESNILNHEVTVFNYNELFLKKKSHTLYIIE